MWRGAFRAAGMARAKAWGQRRRKRGRELSPLSTSCVSGTAPDVPISSHGSLQQWTRPVVHPLAHFTDDEAEVRN